MNFTNEAVSDWHAIDAMVMEQHDAIWWNEFKKMGTNSIIQ